MKNEVKRDASEVAEGIPYPVKLNIADMERNEHGAVVEIVAGGWSFHARTGEGKVYGWGTMDGDTFAGPNTRPRDPARRLSTPTMMEGLPPIQSIKGGRCHNVALTNDGSFLEWKAWGTVWWLQGLPWQTGEVKQLEAGWSFSAVLTEKGEIWVWYSDWSREAFVREYYREHRVDAQWHGNPPNFGDEKVLSIHVSPLQPPSIGEVKVVQIAAGEDFVIALTEDGQIFRLGLQLGPPSRQDFDLARQAFGLGPDFDADTLTNLMPAVHRSRMARYLTTTAQWEHLPAFSSPQSLPGFDSSWSGAGKVGKISHISAHFRRFVVFLSIELPSEEEGGEGKNDTLVLMGSQNGDKPELIPELQARGVIKVTMGDYHYGALTQDGEILTWGSFSKGALGNWPPPWTANDSQPVEEVEEEGSGSGWLGNLIPLPRVFRGGSRVQPRIGRAGAQLQVQARAQEGRSQADVPKPTKIQIRPNKNGGEGEGKPFAFDIAFAGWHSSALVMEAPDSSTDQEGSDAGQS